MARGTSVEVSPPPGDLASVSVRAPFPGSGAVYARGIPGLCNIFTPGLMPLEMLNDWPGIWTDFRLMGLDLGLDVVL